MHKPSCWKSIDIYSSYHPEQKSDVSRADYFVKNWQNLPNSSPKLDLHNINAQTKFGEYQLTCYHQETKLRIDVQQMDGHMDNQWEIIIPCNYCMAGYKKHGMKWLEF